MKLELLTHRRVWAGAISIVVFFTGLAGIAFSYDPVELTELLTALGTALANLIVAGLALYSYIKPKK